MKFLKLCLMGFCLVATQLVANGLQEGKDYILLDKPIANMDNTVLEIYNIGCPCTILLFLRVVNIVCHSNSFSLIISPFFDLEPFSFPQSFA